MTDAIDRDSPVAYYEQLFDILKARILNGHFPLEERLPSELELSRDFGLARATVRQTLSKLESEGYARRIPNRGVYATTPDPGSGWIVQEAEGFFESNLRHGRDDIHTTVIRSGYVTPPRHVTEALRLDTDETVFAIERVRSLDGEVALFSTNWFSAAAGAAIAAAESVLDGSGSVNVTLRMAGFVTDGAQRTIHALAAPDTVAEHLKLAPGHPMLRIRSLSWDVLERGFDYYETWLLTDTVPLEVNVSSAGTR